MIDSPKVPEVNETAVNVVMAKKKMGRPKKSKTAIGDPQPKDKVTYFENFKVQASLEKPLAFNPKVDHSMLEFRKFRADEMHKVRGDEQSGYWQAVKKDTVVLGVKMSDVFVGEGDPQYPWDSYGLYSEGEGTRLADGSEVRELYLAVRPAAVREHEYRLRAKLSAISGTAQNSDVEDLNDGLNRKDPVTGETILSSRVIRADGSKQEVPAVTSARWPSQ